MKLAALCFDFCFYLSAFQTNWGARIPFPFPVSFRWFCPFIFPPHFCSLTLFCSCVLFPGGLPGGGFLLLIPLPIHWLPWSGLFSSLPVLRFSTCTLFSHVHRSWFFLVVHGSAFGSCLGYEHYWQALLTGENISEGCLIKISILLFTSLFIWLW